MALRDAQMDGIGHLFSNPYEAHDPRLPERLADMAQDWAHTRAVEAVKTAAAVRIGRELVHTDPQLVEELLKEASRQAIGTAAKEYAKDLAAALGRTGAERMGAKSMVEGTGTASLLGKLRSAVKDEPAGAALSSVVSKGKGAGDDLAKMLEEGAAKLEAAGDNVNPEVFRSIAVRARAGQLPPDVIKQNLKEMPGVIESRHTNLTGAVRPKSSAVSSVEQGTAALRPNRRPIPPTQHGLPGSTPSMVESPTLAAAPAARPQPPASMAAGPAPAAAPPAATPQGSGRLLPSLAVAGGTGVAAGTTTGLVASRRPQPQPRPMPMGGRPMPAPGRLPPVAWGAAQLPKAASAVGMLVPIEKEAGIGSIASKGLWAGMKGVGKVLAAPTRMAAGGAKLMGAGRVGQVLAGGTAALGTAAGVGLAGLGTVKGVQYATRRHQQFQHQPYQWGNSRHQPYWQSSQM